MDSGMRFGLFRRLADCSASEREGRTTPRITRRRPFARKWNLSYVSIDARCRP